MTEPPSRRLLVVANRTESTPRLLEEVKHRAGTDCQIALMVPPERHPDAPDWTPEDALRLVRRRSEEHTSELQSLRHLVCRLLLEKKKKNPNLLIHDKKNTHQKHN